MSTVMRHAESEYATQSDKSYAYVTLVKGLLFYRVFEAHRDDDDSHTFHEHNYRFIRLSSATKKFEEIKHRHRCGETPDIVKGDHEGEEGVWRRR